MSLIVDHETGEVIQQLPKSLICDYQYRTAEFIQEHPNSAAWIEMGLGKTVSCLMALQNQMDNFDVAHTLIIAPLRVARKVWTDEIDTWEHIREFDVQKILGTAKERTKALKTRAEIHIINRENIPWLYEQMVTDKKWVKKWPWDNVIIDESTSFSYRSSQRWKKLNAMRHKVDRMTLLSGTIDTRSLLGLWAQIFLLDRGERLGFSEKEFHQRFFNMPTRHDPGGKPVAKHFAKKQIAKRLKDMMITLRAGDYLDVKKPQYNYVRVEMTKKEKSVYKELEREKILYFSEDDIVRAVNSGVLANKLLQISNGFAYTDHPIYMRIHDHKIQALMELLEGLSGPVMIAYNYIPDLESIVRALKKAKINFKVLKTEEDEVEWNKGEIDVLIFHPKSAGHGCNLHKSGATNLIWFGLIWSLELYMQANGRLVGGHRAAGRKNVIHHIVTEGTYEDRVRYTLTKNSEHQDEMQAALNSYVQKIRN